MITSSDAVPFTCTESTSDGKIAWSSPIGEIHTARFTGAVVAPDVIEARMPYVWSWKRDAVTETSQAFRLSVAQISAM